MASTEIEIPASDIIVPGSHNIDPYSFPQISDPVSVDAAEVVLTWASRFNAAAQSGESEVSGLFLKSSYWRDLLCMTWDFHTWHGSAKITSLLKNQGKGWRIKSVQVDGSNDLRKPNVSPFDVGGKVKGVQSFLTVETDVGKGRGIVQLLPDDEDEGKWKAFTLLTTLEELTGFEESIYERRPLGVLHGAQLERKTWKERRCAEQEYEGKEPTVLIIGAGQGGLSLAARFRQLGIDALIVDRCDRVGDTWRNRYRQLVLHDPIWYDHMPYLPFPSTWPIFCPKDKLADWFECYANILELNIWTKTTIKESHWNDTSRTWTVVLDLEKDGKTESRTFHPRHIIQATGYSGEANIPSDIEGINDFKGDRLVHSTQFTEAEQNGAGKKAVIIGCCNSGHDIAQDYYEHGYDVTMVQRSSTLVVQSKTIMDVVVKGVYSENGPSVEDADLLSSAPRSIAKRIHIDLTKETIRRDAELLRGLQAAGFALDDGPDHAGLMMKFMQRGGGYYIDVGASQLIVDGAIKIVQGQEVRRIGPHAVVLANGTELPADEVVLATGFQNMRSTTRKILGDAVADRVPDVWGFDEEGESRTMWRRTGHPGFWFMGGNLALARFYSRLLALQIKALEEGIVGYEDK